MVTENTSLNIEGSRPEWCISSLIYSRDTQFWSETLSMVAKKNISPEVVETENSSPKVVDRTIVPK